MFGGDVTSPFIPYQSSSWLDVLAPHGSICMRLVLCRCYLHSHCLHQC